MKTEKASPDLSWFASQFPRLVTPRCILTLLTPEQASLLVQYKRRNRAHLAPWEPAPYPTLTLEESCSREAERSVEGYTKGTAVQFIALERESQAMVAGCNFTNIVRGPLQACHLGYSVDLAYQGRGLAREVVQAGIAYMFDTLGLHRIMANHMPSNERSAKLLAAIGFEREGYARAYLRIAGQWEDMVLNALIHPMTNAPPL